MAINDIKIKSHDIYLEKDNNKGGNLTVNGTINVVGIKNTFGGLTTSSIANVSTITINSPTVNINSQTMNVTASDMHIMSPSNSMHRITVRPNGNNCTIQSQQAIVLDAYAGLFLKTSDLVGSIEINSPAININSSSLNGISLTTSGSTNVINISSPTLKISSSSSNDISLTTSGSTNVISINSPTLKIDSPSLSLVQSSISISNVEAKGIYLTASSGFTVNSIGLGLIGYYSLSTESRGHITISSPTVNVKTNKIDLSSHTENSSINIDDFIKYTPSTIPDGNNKRFTFTKNCNTSLFIKNNLFYEKTMLAGQVIGYALCIIKNLSTSEKDLLNTAISDYAISDIKLTLTGTNGSATTSETFSLQRSNVTITDSSNTENPDSIIIDITNLEPQFSLLRSYEDKLSSFTSVSGEFSATIIGRDSIMAIDKCSEVKINNNNHLLLTCSSSTATTNISYFPNAVYNGTNNRLVIEATSNVTLYPGDFIEYYPVGGYPCYIWNTEFFGNSAETTSKKPGYIYFDPNGDVYIRYDQNYLNQKTSSQSIDFTFLVSAGQGASSFVVIKK